MYMGMLWAVQTGVADSGVEVGGNEPSANSCSVQQRCLGSKRGVAHGGHASRGLRRHEATAQATSVCKSCEVAEVHKRLQPVPCPGPSDCTD